MRAGHGGVAGSRWRPGPARGWAGLARPASRLVQPSQASPPRPARTERLDGVLGPSISHADAAAAAGPARPGHRTESTRTATASSEGRRAGRRPPTPAQSGRNRPLPSLAARRGGGLRGRRPAAPGAAAPVERARGGRGRFLSVPRRRAGLVAWHGTGGASRAWHGVARRRRRGREIRRRGRVHRTMYEMCTRCAPPPSPPPSRRAGWAGRQRLAGPQHGSRTHGTAVSGRRVSA